MNCSVESVACHRSFRWGRQTSVTVHGMWHGSHNIMLRVLLHISRSPLHCISISSLPVYYFGGPAGFDPPKPPSSSFSSSEVFTSPLNRTADSYSTAEISENSYAQPLTLSRALRFLQHSLIYFIIRPLRIVASQANSFSPRASFIAFPTKFVSVLMTQRISSSFTACLQLSMTASGISSGLQ